MDPIVILIVVVALILGWWFSYQNAKKRRAAMKALAAEMGFRFDPEKNRSLAQGYAFIKHLNEGSNRYACNILSGHSPGGEPVLMFDFHYETGSGKHTQHHECTVLSLKLPRRFPELQIEPEGLGSILKQAIGFDDIDFESLEFSKRYDVRSTDKKFAYDFCHARMIDYLMRSRSFIIEVDNCNLVLVFKELLPPALYRANYQRLLEIRGLMPNYLFD